MSRSDRLLWVAYAAFVGLALWLRWSERPFALDGPLWGIKLGLWLAWGAFTAYSVRCSLHESLLASIREIGKLHWGRQVGLDLYIGLTLALLLIGLHAGSPWVALAWLPALYLFGNLATLVWFAIHFDGLVARLALAGSG